MDRTFHSCSLSLLLLHHILAGLEKVLGAAKVLSLWQKLEVP